jgi:hypothetical protein
MQWWGALTKQFTELATNAMKDGDAARSMAGAMVKSPFDAATAPPKKTVARKKPAAAKKAAARTR